MTNGLLSPRLRSRTIQNSILADGTPRRDSSDRYSLGIGTGCAIVLVAAMALCGCGTPASTQTAASTHTAAPPQSVTPTQPVAAARQEPSLPASGLAATSSGLSDLDAMTSSCPKAGLNAAAREAAKVPSQGHYQFSYFKLISHSHHSAYEVHFKSNYHGEPDLKYCVSIYCQQGWDPTISKVLVSPMGDGLQRTKAAAPGAAAAGAAHGADCGEHQKRLKRGSKR
jgi:hypothetical protein